MIVRCKEKKIWIQEESVLCVGYKYALKTSPINAFKLYGLDVLVNFEKECVILVGRE